MFYKIISLIIRLLYSDLITSKPIRNTLFRLNYRIKDHLTFFGKKTIVYEKNIWDNILPYLEGCNLIFDIGSNIGQYSLRFSNGNDLTKKIIAFEPDPINIAFLDFNIKMNNIKNVIIEPFGIGTKDEENYFYQDNRTGGRLGSFIKGTTESNKIKVETKSFNSILEKYGEPDFIKIDIEGYEGELFRNLKYLFQKAIILIEVREDTKNIVYNYFSKSEYSCYLVDREKRKIINISEIPDFANLLFTRDKK